MLTVRESLSFTRHYLADTATGPYYEAFDDGNTESLRYVDPDRPEESVTLIRVWSWDSPLKSVEEVMRDHLRKRGFDTPPPPG